MKLRTDTILHLKAGLIVLVGSAAFLVLGYVLGLSPYTTGLALSGLVAAGAEEYAQGESNSRLAAMGQPELHDASLGDLVASAATCWVAAVGLEIALLVGAL